MSITINTVISVVTGLGGLALIPPCLKWIDNKLKNHYIKDIESQTKLLTAQANLVNADNEKERIKLEKLKNDRLLPTWCPSCDVNMKFTHYAQLPDSENFRASYKCPSCKVIGYAIPH